MAQKDIGDAGEAGADMLPAHPQVLRRPHPAAPRAEVQPGRAGQNGGSVPQVVVSRHRKAVLREKTGQGLVAADVLRHTVAQLHHAHRRRLRLPHHRVDRGLAVGGEKGKFTAHHGNTHLRML